MFALFAFPLFALIFMTVNAMWLIIDEWKYYHYRSWSIIIFASLSIIILWIFYWCSIIKWLFL